MTRWRLRTVFGVSGILLGVACASSPNVGPLGEGSATHPRITSVDVALAPHHASVQMDQPGFIALLLVAPGHSATLLYPGDSVTRNELGTGTHEIAFQIPELLIVGDSARNAPTESIRSARMRGSRQRRLQPLPPSTPTYLLLVSSPQPLQYARIIEKTAGVSIPMLETEALNAVGKAIKSTIANEPREWAGYFLLVELRKR